MESTVESKIKQFVIDKNLKETLRELPKHGNYYVENEYKLSSNPKLPEMLFVISKRISFHNHSIADKRYCVYAFDKNTGELSKDFEGNGKCYEGFYNESVFIKDII